MPHPQTTNQNTVLEMREVTITDLNDSDRIVLKDVNWQVRSGDYWAVGGLHGSGKTNFLYSAAGVLPPASGSYRVFGAELTAGYEHERLAPRLRIGTIFDGGRLLHHLSVAENIALPVRYHYNRPLEEIAARVEALLEFVDMSSHAISLPGSLSRNWQQRVGLARALVLKPAILLFDTPLTGLDPRDAGWWLDTMDSLAKGHPLLDDHPATLVATTDDLRPWRARARQFGLLRDKTLNVVGSGETLDKMSKDSDGSITEAEEEI
jgi:ABC-type transporter Mla maintaining outer membrane lipid asymmetry ATPase subunit MlaF